VSTQSNGKTENLRPFPKGVSGNPGGRPRKAVKLLAQAVREMVDPREIVASMQTVAAGQPLNGIKPKVSDMLDANKWLADRGWGKAQDFQPLDQDTIGLDDAYKAAGELRAEILRLTERREEGPTIKGAADSSKPS
jgi:Family of unknown function (DUF5681)